MNTISISYNPPPLSCEFMSIDKLDEDISFLAELLDSFKTLSDEQRDRINNALKQIAKTHRRIDDDADVLKGQYNTVDEERDDLWDELQRIKNTQDYLSALVDVPHLENDLYTALKIARDSGSETASMPISLLEQVHHIVENLSR